MAKGAMIKPMLYSAEISGARSARTVFFISSAAVEQGASADLLGVPFLINEEGHSEDEFNEYLLARRNGDWQGRGEPGGMVAEASGVDVLRADLKYLRQRAYHLDQFRRWCRSAGIAHVHAGEADLVSYAEYLEEAPKRGGGDGRKATSINQALIAVMDALNYLAARGARDALVLKMSYRKGDVPKPLVLRREDEGEIPVWYSENEIEDFLKEFDTATGKLASLLMYKLALRLSETIHLAVDAFPRFAEFRSDPAVRNIQIMGKFGKTRSVEVDEESCRAVEKYVAFDRELRAPCRPADARILLLGPKRDGTIGRLTPRYVQKLFERARAAACKSALWPHALRHHWATHRLLRSWKRKASSGRGSAIPFDIPIAQTLLSADLILIKEQLGHSHLETTMSYLRGVVGLLKAEEYEAYSDALESP